MPVLIFGETGSGKELVAPGDSQPVASGRRAFIRVNCGAIPHELIDSQLFGHERGAFTGAIESRKGWFERADGGTLLLDELGELPLAAQVRLLRILQDGWLDRVGGQRPINVDVRIVAATHRDLAAWWPAGNFARTSGIGCGVSDRAAAVAERREDIPELARHFAQRAATRFGLYPAMPTQEDLDLLVAYSWPGNVRELATVIDRAAILGDGKRLEVAKSLGVPTSPAAARPRRARRRRRRWPRARPRSCRWMRPCGSTSRRRWASPPDESKVPRGAAQLLEINPHTLRAGCESSGSTGSSFGHRSGLPLRRARHLALAPNGFREVFHKSWDVMEARIASEDSALPSTCASGFYGSAFLTQTGSNHLVLAKPVAPVAEK